LVAALNAADFGEDKHDLVYARGALHNLSRVEHVIEQSHRCLKPGGMLLSDEDIGPAYNDLSDRHREVVNAAIHLIPSRLRHASENTFVSPKWQSPSWKRGFFELLRLITLRPPTYNFEGFQISVTWPSYKQSACAIAKKISIALAKWEAKKPADFRVGQVWDTAPDQIRRVEPSEGVCGDEIIPVIQSFFRASTVNCFNGSMLQYARDWKFFDNYDPDRGLPNLKLLMEIERQMLDPKEIPPILVVIVVRK
jgi:hypothetical protein